MFCANCGSKVEGGVEFCPNCGAVQTTEQQNAEYEGQNAEDPLAKKYKHLKIANIIAWVLFVLSAGAAVTFLVLWMGLNSAYWSMLYRYNNDSRKNTAVCKAFDIPQSDTSLYVAIDKVYNYADGSTHLDHTKITYLQFSYSLLADYRVSESEKLYVRIIQPNGELERNPSVSPDGYTLACDAKNSSEGWGSSTPGSAYSKGCYTIEFWYKDSLVGRKTVTIY